MSDMTWLVERAKRIEEALGRGIEPECLAEIQHEDGAEAAIAWQRDACGRLAAEYFRAGLFPQASHHQRLQADAAKRYEELLEREGDAEGACMQREERAQSAWLTGDLKLYRAYVEERCDPRADAAPGLDGFPELFFSWAVLREQFHPHHWSERFEEAVETRRDEIWHQWMGERGAIAGAVSVDVHAALASFWRGHHDRARAEAERAHDAFRRWGRMKPPGLVIPRKRTSRNRMAGIVAVIEGRTRAARLPKAASSFTKALVASAQTRDIDWTDLVLLRLVALYNSDPASPAVESFVASFPHLAHLLERRREWRELTTAG